MPVSINPGVKFNLPFTLGLPDRAPTDIDPKLQQYFQEMYNAFQQIQIAMHNVLGVGQQLKQLWPNLGYTQTLHTFSSGRLYLAASEFIQYGSSVNIFDSGGGVMQFRNANATTNARPAHGICTTAGGIAIAGFGEVITQMGLLTGVTGLTKGVRYFLSTTNGLLTAAEPVAAGNIGQAVGLALDTS